MIRGGTHGIRALRIHVPTLPRSPDLRARSSATTGAKCSALQRLWSQSRVPRTPRHARRGMTEGWGLTLGTACGEAPAWVMPLLADARIAELDGARAAVWLPVECAWQRLTSCRQSVPDDGWIGV